MHSSTESPLDQFEAIREALPDVFYGVPDPLASIEEFARWRHANLDGMTRAELLRERARVRLRLTVDDAPDPWLIERLRALEEAIRHAG